MGPQARRAALRHVAAWEVPDVPSWVGVSCGLSGHPEVSFLDSAGRVIARAVPLSFDRPAVALSTGEQAGAEIGVVSGCLGARAVVPASMRVELPSGGATTVDANGLRICSGQNPTIRPFQKA